MTTKRKTAKASKKAGKSKPKARRSARGALTIATSARKSVPERVAAMTNLPLAVAESDDEHLQALMAVLRNEDEPIKVRLAALQSLQAASFSSAAFESCRGDFIATLRKVADDPDPEIRQRVLGILAREKDGFAQKKLLDGLKDPAKALVPPEKALQLLTYDVHAEAYSIARDIVSNPPNPEARHEALRLLAADATSAPMFEKLLRDKDELRDVRQVAASALQALDPEKLQKHARAMILDKSEYDDIQATSLTALSQFGDDESVAKDNELLKSVDRVSASKAPTKYKQSARRFLSKHGK
jgi:HEAT repeat protein